MGRAAAALTLCLVLVVWACGSSLRTVETIRHPVSAPAIEVGFPPPPAEVDNVPPDPGAPCVWLDGHFRWSGRAKGRGGQWGWTAGAWVTPSPGCRYAPAAFVWLPPPTGTTGRRDPGRLFWFKPAWYREEGGRLEPCPAPTTCAVAQRATTDKQP